MTTESSRPGSEPAGAIVLAGGSSSRMGFDKRSLLVAGVPIVDHLYAALRPRFDRIIVGADDPERWAHLDVQVVADERPGMGPLMGLASCLARAAHDLNFVIACDIPRPPLALVERLLAEARGRDGAIPINASGYIEPLFGTYRRRLVPAARRLLDEGARQIRALYEEHDFAFVSLAQMGIAALPNINTPGDFARHIAVVSREG